MPGFHCKESKMSRYIIDGNLNGEIYWDILENKLPTLFENLSLEVR